MRPLISTMHGPVGLRGRIRWIILIGLICISRQVWCGKNDSTTISLVPLGSSLGTSTPVYVAAGNLTGGTTNSSSGPKDACGRASVAFTELNPLMKKLEGVLTLMAGAKTAALTNGSSDASSFHKVFTPGTWVPCEDGELPAFAVWGGPEQAVARTLHAGVVSACRLLPANGTCLLPWGGAEVAKNKYEVLVGPGFNWTLREPPVKKSSSGVTIDPGKLGVCRVTYLGIPHIGRIDTDTCYYTLNGKEVTNTTFEFLKK